MTRIVYNKCKLCDRPVSEERYEKAYKEDGTISHLITQTYELQCDVCGLKEASDSYMRSLPGWRYVFDDVKEHYHICPACVAAKKWPA